MDIFNLDAICHVEAPRQNIYEFNGKLTICNLKEISIDKDAGDSSMESNTVEALTMENTLWANTTVTFGTVAALVIYTGKETRRNERDEVEEDDKEVEVEEDEEEVEEDDKEEVEEDNEEVEEDDKEVEEDEEEVEEVEEEKDDEEERDDKEEKHDKEVVEEDDKEVEEDEEEVEEDDEEVEKEDKVEEKIKKKIKFMLLVSSIIPIALRVNLEMAKILYSFSIMKDPKIPETLVRTSNIPEELGRIDYLLTDKTGTLTKNDMIWKRLHVGRASFGPDDIPKLREFVSRYYENFSQTEIAEETAASASLATSSSPSTVYVKRPEIISIVNNAVKALSLCHNVSPLGKGDNISYQAASPDEVALVNFANSVGLKLIERDERYIILQTPFGYSMKYSILQCFPFSSEMKRMGIIVREEITNKILFFVKGAESVLLALIQPRGSSWLREECDNLARQGFRTLALAYRELTENQLKEFQKRYSVARASMFDRSLCCQEEIDRITCDLYLLGLTGVEDKLYPDIPQTLESLHHAGIKVWMLTGDKVETATCVAISAGLKSRRHTLQVISSQHVSSLIEAQEALQAFASGPAESVLVVDGAVLEIYLKCFAQFFIDVAAHASS
ncbi:cation-transporting atpase family protein, partial [Cardiosporidium cionae]